MTAGQLFIGGETFSYFKCLVSFISFLGLVFPLIHFSITVSNADVEKGIDLVQFNGRFTLNISPAVDAREGSVGELVVPCIDCVTLGRRRLNGWNVKTDHHPPVSFLQLFHGVLWLHGLVGNRLGNRLTPNTQIYQIQNYIQYIFFL